MVVNILDSNETVAGQERFREESRKFVKGLQVVYKLDSTIGSLYISPIQILEYTKLGVVVEGYQKCEDSDPFLAGV